MSTLSRRSLVTTAAALPALAVPAAAAAEPDPIFALIDKHRAAFEALEAALGDYDDWDDDIPTRLGEERQELDVQLASTKPTTIAGVVAIMRYRREHEEQDYELFALKETSADPRIEVSSWLAVIEQALAAIGGRAA